VVKPVSVDAMKDAKLGGAFVAELALCAVLVWIPVRYPDGVVQWYHIAIEAVGIFVWCFGGVWIAVRWGQRRHRRSHRS
jgi:uncharacterized membrane protein YeiH